MKAHPRPVSSSPVGAQLRQLQGAFKFSLGAKHQILRAITAVRDLGTEQYLAGFQAESFDRMSRSIKSSSGTRHPSKGGTGYTRVGANIGLSQSEKIARATKIQVLSTRANWIKCHGKEVDSRVSSQAVKALFAALEDSEGRLNCGSLIGHILTTGLAENVIDLKIAFETTFACCYVYNFRLDEALFSSLFHTKKAVDRTISVLRQVDSARNPPTRSAADPQPHWIFPTFTRSISILQSWWSDLTPTKAEYVHIRKLADFLVSQGIVGNRHEGQRLIRAVGKPVEEVYVLQTHYLKLFYPALLKATVVNMTLGLACDSTQGNGSSMRLRMADLERKVMLSGLKSHKTVSKEKTAFAVYSDFVKAGRLYVQRGKVQEAGNALIPSIAKDMTFELRGSPSPSAKTAWETSIGSATAKSRLSDNCRSSSLSSDSPDPPSSSHSRLQQQKYFKSAGVPILSKEARLQRETRLHQHFENMVEFASELDQVLAGCKVLG